MVLPPIPAKRYVTGHNDSGKAVIAIEEQAGVIRFGPAGKADPAAECVRVSELWIEPQFPSDNSMSEDIAGETNTSQIVENLVVPNGMVLRAVDFPPRYHDQTHRTQSLDFGIVISGEIYMQVDDKKEIHLKTGECVVQRGSNNYCRMYFVLAAANKLNNISGEADYNPGA